MARYKCCLVWLLFSAAFIWGNDYFINPLNSSVPPFRLESLTTNVSISPENGIQDFAVSYIITDEYGHEVFRENRASSIGDYPEYFITEDSYFYTRIPSFEWNGFSNNGRVVPDGKYILSILFSRRNNEGFLKDKNGRIVRVTTTYTIFVKTRPPEFYILIIDIPSVSPGRLTDTKKIVFGAMTNKDDINTVAHAASWIFEIQNADTGEIVAPRYVYSADAQNETQIALPYIEWNTENLTGNYTVTITGIDNVFNQNSQSKTINLYTSVSYTAPPKGNSSVQAAAKERDMLNITAPLAVNIQKNEPVFTGDIILAGKFSPPALRVYDTEGLFVTEIIEREVVESAETIHFEWYGTDSNNNFVASSGKKYTIVLELEDGSIVSKTAAAGFLYSEKDGKAEIIIPDIIFPANRHNFIDDASLLVLNRFTMNNISSIIKDNLAFISQIIIEGYANPTAWPDRERMERENKRELIPLSLRRADAIKNLLILMGVPDKVLTTKGKGGMGWIVPPNNRELNYQNRKIKFLVVFKEIP